MASTAVLPTGDNFQRRATDEGQAAQEIAELLGDARPPEQVALELVAAAQLEEARLRLGLDALGDNLGAEVPAHRDQPVEHRHRLRI